MPQKGIDPLMFLKSPSARSPRVSSFFSTAPFFSLTLKPPLLFVFRVAPQRSLLDDHFSPTPYSPPREGAAISSFPMLALFLVSFLVFVSLFATPTLENLFFDRSGLLLSDLAAAGYFFFSFHTSIFIVLSVFLDAAGVFSFIVPSASFASYESILLIFRREGVALPSNPHTPPPPSSVSSRSRNPPI